MSSFSCILLMVSEKKIFEYFLENFALYVAPSTNQIKRFRRSHMKRGGLLNNHICTKNTNIPNGSEEIVNFHFSHYKSMETISCHNNQSSYPTGKKKLFVALTCRCYVCNMERIGHTASEEMSFENVDGRTDARCLYILQAHLRAFGSSELINK